MTADRQQDPLEQTSVEDPLAVVIALDSSVEFSTRNDGTQIAYVARDRRTGKFYRFGAREFHAAEMMDGRRTLSQIHEALEKDGLPWSAIDVVSFARELTQHRLASVVERPKATENGLQRPGSDAPKDSQTVPASSPVGHSKNAAAVALRFLSGLLTQRFPLASGDRVASRLLPTFGRCFTTTATLLWTILVASGLGIVWAHSDAFASEIRRVFDQQLWLFMALLWCGLKLVHECGHAVCAKKHGVHVGKMGVMLFLMAPLAYVDVTDAWKLVRRRDRVQIALAGIYVELAIGAAAAWIWWCSPVGFTKHLAAQVFLIAGPATLLVNANPLLRLDGYYVLSDLLEIPNLRALGRQRLTALIEAVLFRLPVPECPLNGWRRDFAVFHAACSVLFQIVWMSGLIIAVSAWARGLGIALAVVAVLCWGLVPLVRWMHKIWTLEANEGWILNVYQRRLIAVCTVVSLVFQYASVHTSPFARRVPVVVRFQNEQIARAPSDAFVAAVFVRCGDRVQRGTLLMELEQPELILQRDQLFDQHELELSKVVQHRRRGELALVEVATQNAASLQRRLDEINTQIESMRIIAHRDGKITTPTTDHLLGSYVHQGDELLRVSDPQEKEILAVVAEDNLDAYKNAVSGGRLAQVRLRGGVTIRTPLSEVQPSASRRLPHPAMAVTAGGPLPIELNDRADSPKLVHAHLQSVLPLDALTSLEVESGQIGRLTIPDDRTLVSRLWDQIKNR